MSDAHVDTDVMIRFLTGDDPRKRQDTIELFARVERNELRLSAPVTVIADAVYVLGSRRNYGWTKTQVRAALLPLLNLPAFDLRDRDVVLRALDVFVAYPALDFGDAMTVASLQLSGATDVYAYDRHFDRVPGITRIGPGAT